ncbi:hypothetical protein M3223_13245 [Paenibacillus pasadenensis]|uniref:hypothetical protein n=1 Tax=Paenibacillus pasadenensis TaxID=217090 RepID=UPI00203A6959|nr:hypothetical protein [Paenibacillus pasadenensis]MCM3748316.1 hypothetical protein [Paenibacillus pasadenensis]
MRIRDTALTAVAANAVASVPANAAGGQPAAARRTGKAKMQRDLLSGGWIQTGIQ